MKIGKIKFSICTFQFAISNIIALQLGAPWRHRRLALEAQAPRLCLLRMLIRHVRGRPLTRSARASILASNMLIPHVPTYLELKINV